MFRNGDDYLGVLLTEGPPASRCEWSRSLPSDDFGPRALARLREGDQAVVVRGIAIADAAWRRTVPRVQALASVLEPHVATLVAYGRHDGLGYFIEEHHDGPRLDRVLHEEGGSLPRHVALPVFAQILLAVSEAHRRDVVVGGVRPQDVRIVKIEGEHLEIRLRSFGLAAVLGVPAGRRGSTDHPSLFRAPEPDVSLHPASDVYSLAVLLVRMITGPLLPSSSEAERADLLATRVDDALYQDLIDEPIAALLTRCLEVNRTARPQDAIELLAALRQVVPADELRLPEPVEPKPFVTEGVQHWPARQWTVPDAWERPRRGVDVAAPLPGAAASPAEESRRAWTPKGRTLRAAAVPRREELMARNLRRAALGLGVVSTIAAVAVGIAIFVVERDPVEPPAPAPATSEASVPAATPREATLRVETRPGSRLTIDGVTRSAPEAPVVLTPGRHVVRVEADGYLAWRTLVDVKAGQEHRLVVDLERDAGPMVAPIPAAIAAGYRPDPG